MTASEETRAERKVRVTRAKLDAAARRLGRYWHRGLPTDETDAELTKTLLFAYQAVYHAEIDLATERRASRRASRSSYSFAETERRIMARVPVTPRRI